jgi:hypothetical protein
MEDKLPCEDCILLPICSNKKNLNCKLLIKFLSKCMNKLNYPDWPNMLDLVRKTLNGNWCVVSINRHVTKVQKDRKITDGFR